MRIGDVWRENAKEGLTFIEGENYFVNDVFFYQTVGYLRLDTDLKT